MPKFDWGAMQKADEAPPTQKSGSTFDWGSMQKADAPARPDASGKFSWDKMQKRAEPSTSTGMAALEGFGNAASMGYLPQLQAGAETVGPKTESAIARGFGVDTPQSVDEKLRAQGFKIEQPENTYISERDANIKRMQKQSEEHPIAAGAAGLAGGLATGIATSALAPINAASRIGRALQAAKAGAIMGAVANPGDTEGQLADGLQIGDRAGNSAKGGALGGVMQGGLETLSKVTGALANIPKSLQDRAAERAFKSSGAMLKDYRRAASKPVYDAAGKIIPGEDRVGVLGKYMLEKGLIKPGMTVDDIRAAAESLASKHGEDVTSILEKLDAAGLDAPSAQGLSTLIQKEAEPLKDMVTAKPTYKTLQNLSKDVKSFAAKEAPIVESQGAVGPLTGKGTEFLTDPVTGEVIGKFHNGNLVKSGGPSISPEMAAAETAITPTNIASTGAGGTFKNAQQIKKFIADQVESAGGFQSLSPTEKNLALRKAYTVVKSEMEKSAGKAAQDIGDPGVLNRYLDAKSGYRNAEEIAGIAKDYGLRNRSNKPGSLTDYMTGIGGMVAGAATGNDLESKVKNALIGASLGGVNKLGRKYGNPLLSSGMYKAGKALESLPLVGEAGQTLAPLLAKAERSPLATANAIRAVSEPKLNENGSSLRGESKWASAGGQKLGLSQNEIDQAMKSRDSMRMLIEASDLPAGSKQLERIRAQIKNRGKQ